jgi:hypothetical protein
VEWNPEVMAIAGMAVTSDHRRTALQDFLNKHEKLNPNRWEKQANLGEGTLRKFLEGKTDTLTGKTYDKLRIAASDLLGRSVGLYELQGGDGFIVPFSGRPNGQGATSGLERANNVRDKSVTMLAVWKLAHSSSGRLGAFVLSNEQVDEIPRDMRLSGAKRAFSCKLLDNANGPGYRAGHLLVVDPDVGATIGDLCVFTDEAKIATGASSIAAILKAVTASYWIITQNEVAGDQQLDREEYPQAWPVVVHYPHGT